MFALEKLALVFKGEVDDQLLGADQSVAQGSETVQCERVVSELNVAVALRLVNCESTRDFRSSSGLSKLVASPSYISFTCPSVASVPA